MLKALPILCLATLAACSGPTDRIALNAQAPTLSLRPLVQSVMVRTVSLPTYAAAEEVSREVGAGLIASDDSVLWADDPQRAITLVLAQSLGTILNTDVGPEPWPFVGLPDVSVDVRVAQMLAGADGNFRLSGQVYVGGDGISYRNTAEAFDIRVPMADQSLASISAAQSTALLQLAETIARRLGR